MEASINSKTYTLQKRNDIISKTIDSLLNIRLILSVKKIVTPKIKKQDLSDILEKEKNKLDEMVVTEIDKVFEEFDLKFSGIDKPLSLLDMENSINNDTSNNNFKDKAEEKGKVKQFNSRYFNNSSSDLPQAS